jgi:signal transduction histidine kinase
MSTDIKTHLQRGETVAIGVNADLKAQHERTIVLGQLAGGMAHDFNNILNIIAGSAAMIEEYPTNLALVLRCARRMTLAAERGSAISGRLLTFAKRDNGGVTGRLDIKELFDSIQELLVPLLPANIHLQTVVEDNLPLVQTDRAQLETVLVNLATNARDAMSRGGKLIFSAGLTKMNANDLGLNAGSYVRIAVTDNGNGMDEATVARVMEPFFTTKPQGHGTGLGLPLAKDFAEQCGGALEISSVPRVSTEVRLWLPVVSVKQRAACLVTAG